MSPKPRERSVGGVQQLAGGEAALGNIRVAENVQHPTALLRYARAERIAVRDQIKFVARNGHAALAGECDLCHIAEECVQRLAGLVGSHLSQPAQGLEVVAQQTVGEGTVVEQRRILGGGVGQRVEGLVPGDGRDVQQHLAALHPLQQPPHARGERGGVFGQRGDGAIVRRADRAALRQPHGQVFGEIAHLIDELHRGGDGVFAHGQHGQVGGRALRLAGNVAEQLLQLTAVARHQQLAQVDGHGFGQLAGLIEGLLRGSGERSAGGVEPGGLRKAHAQQSDGQRGRHCRQRTGPVPVGNAFLFGLHDPKTSLTGRSCGGR